MISVICVLCADDITCLVFSSNTWEPIKRKATVDLNKIFKELSNKEKELTLNISKS